MAYISQEKKKELSPEIKAVLKKYSFKGSIAVRHHSTLVVNVKSGPLELPHSVGYCQVNTYWIVENWSKSWSTFLLELKTAMMNGNHDNSEIQSDYFDVGWYVDINIGKYDKPYIVK